MTRSNQSSGEALSRNGDDQLLRTQNGALLSPLGLGCSRYGSFGNMASTAALYATIDQAIDSRINVFDTADIYGQGDSERILGCALLGRSEDAFVMTKIGKVFSTKMRLLRPLKPLLKPLLRRRGAQGVLARRSTQIAEDFTPSRLSAALDASLRRLRLERVDGLFLHSPPAHVAADPEVAEILLAMRRAGKLRHFGVSCDDRACLDAALTISGLELLQLPVDMIAAMGSDAMQILTARGITVFAREAILLRPDLSPPAAVHAARHLPGVSTVLAGASNPERIAQLAQSVIRLSDQVHEVRRRD